MYCIIFTPFFHYAVCYVCTITLQGGIIGCGLSGVITNLFIFFVQIYFINESSEEGFTITEVTIYDERNFDNIGDFLKLAIPSTFIALTEWSAYHSIIIIGGLISVTNQIFVVVTMQISI